MADSEKKGRQYTNLNISRTKRAFKMKWKPFLIIIKGKKKKKKKNDLMKKWKMANTNFKLSLNQSII